MESKTEQEEDSTTPKLPLLLKVHNGYTFSPPSSEMATSPIHTLASVPFCWEEEPGKPKLTTEFPRHNSNHHKFLDLPPRLLVSGDSNIVTKLPSPTTVLDGPYSMGRSRRFESSSFRMMVMNSQCYGSSFRSSYSPVHDVSDEKVGALIVTQTEPDRDRSGFLGSWRKKVLKAKREVGEGSYVFLSSAESETASASASGFKTAKIKRTGSFSSTVSSNSKSRFWATICKGLKQVVPWKSKKQKRDGFMT